MSLKQKVISRLSRMRESYDLSDLFRDKRVVLLGPCSEMSEALLEQVHNADILVTVNKGHRMPLFYELKRHVNKVLLFHCLEETEDGGGGCINTREMRKKGFRELAYAQYKGVSDHKVAAFHWKNYALLKLYRVDKDLYQELVDSVMGARPTTGYGTIWTIAKSNCSHLYVSGLTFMRTPYSPKYDSGRTDLTRVRAVIEKAGNHNPDYELMSFCQLIKDYPVSCDPVLSDIVNQPLKPAFYQQTTGESESPPDGYV